jgi:hypothetical protein
MNVIQHCLNCRHSDSTICLSRLGSNPGLLRLSHSPISYPTLTLCRCCPQVSRACDLACCPTGRPSHSSSLLSSSFLLSSWQHRYAPCTAKTKFRKFETNIPGKGISGSQFQFPHSCVCERIIYSHDGSAFSAVGNMFTDPGNI